AGAGGVPASATPLPAAFARMAAEHGADALMVAPPAGQKNLDAVVDYYLAVAQATALPMVIQDEPVTTQVTMPAAFIARLAAAVPRVEAVEARGGPAPPQVPPLPAPP